MSDKKWKKIADSAVLSRYSLFSYTFAFIYGNIIIIKNSIP